MFFTFSQSLELLHRHGKTLEDVLRQAEHKAETAGMRELLVAAREELGMEVILLSLL